MICQRFRSRALWGAPAAATQQSGTVKSGEFYEPEHTSRGPAKLTQLEPISLEADRAALWSASEAAIGEKWEL